PTPGLILPSTWICVQVVNDNVILVSTDLDPTTFQWSNPRSGLYAHIAYLNSPIGVILVPRVWESVDVQFNNRAFRFIGTDLDATDANVCALQAGELRSGPANTALPVIIAMDANAQAALLPQDAAYLDFLAAGYNDAWSDIFPNVPGFTCCQAQLDNNPVSELLTNIDLILTLAPLD